MVQTKNFLSVLNIAKKIDKEPVIITTVFISIRYIRNTIGYGSHRRTENK